MSYTNFQTYPPQVLHLLHNAHWEILPWDNQVTLSASYEELYTLHKTPSFVSCMTFFHLLNHITTDDFLCLLVNTLPRFHPSTTLYWAVHHSKFERLLLDLFQSIWLTCGLFSGFGKYVKAIKRLTLRDLPTEFTQRLTKSYQSWDFDIIKNLHLCPHDEFFGWLQTLPSSVTAYLHSYPGISRIKKWLKVIQESCGTCTTFNHLSCKTFGY